MGTSPPFVPVDTSLQEALPPIDVLEAELAQASTDYERIAAHCRLVRWHRLEGGEAGAKHARSAIRIARSTGDPDALCWALLEAVRAAIGRDRRDEALRHLDEARRLSPLCANLACAAQVYHYHTYCVRIGQGSAAALEELGVAVELAERSEDVAVRVSIGLEQAILYNDCGRAADALAVLLRLRTEVRTIEHVMLEQNVLHSLGITHCHLLDYEAAESCFREALALPTTGRAALRRRMLTMRNLATLNARGGRLDEALEIITSALELTDELPISEKAPVFSSLAEILNRLGRADEALEHIDRAIACGSARMGMSMLDTISLRARILASLGRFVEAVEQQEATLDEARRRGALVRQCHALETLADIHEAAGNLAEAFVASKEARTLRDEISGAEQQRRAAQAQMEATIMQAASERERARREAEELEQRLRERESELASAGLQVVEKSRLLESILRDIGELSRVVDRDARRSVTALVRRIESNRDSGSYWKRFEEQFEKVHSGFLETLARRFPALTPTELRVCALLRLQMSTKEIADLLASSPDSIEVYRYRLRKKFGLERKTSFTHFFASLEEAGVV